MKKQTKKEYLRNAENWLIKYIDDVGLQRKPNDIADALVLWSDGMRPNTYRKKRAELVYQQQLYGFYKSAKKLRLVQRMHHGEADTKKTKRCKHVSEEEHEKLLVDAQSRNDDIMVMALKLAYAAGVRPEEMRSMTWFQSKFDRNLVIHIIGAKQDDDRGVDRDIVVEFDPELILAMETLSQLERRDIVNLNRRVSYNAHKIFSRRKHPPTLYSYRHQMGSDVKASGDRRAASAIMGHRSQESLAVYGHANARGGLKRKIPSVSNQAVSRVNEKLIRDPAEECNKHNHSREGQQYDF